MEIAAGVALVVGYGAALPIMFRLRTIFAKRQQRWFAAFLVALAVIVVGHLLAGRPIAAAINAAGAGLLAYAWRRTGGRT